MKKLTLLWVLVLMSVPAGCARPKPVSADTWATVDGRSITRDDVEKTFRRTQDGAATLSPEEAMTAKLSLLNEMILQDILAAKARALKIEVTDERARRGLCGGEEEPDGRGVRGGVEEAEPQRGGHA